MSSEEPADPLAAMGQMQCAYCFSTHLRIIGSYETREVVVVHCLDCGRLSELDTENQNVEMRVESSSGPSS